jgi:pantoate--beta-alanine ligase
MPESSRIPVWTTVEAVRAAVRDARARGQSIALVPTMGALHDGHARLVEEARAAGGFVIVSIYVNPKQFGPSEDLAKYPRALEADCAICARAGADGVFHPADAEMYPRGISAPLTMVVEPELTRRHEGPLRVGHFDGVTTVVMKLFQIVGPDRAYFGRKDYQQLRVVSRMVEDLNIPVEIIPVATVREPDGLAMSSRNAYLTDPADRAAATALHRALEAARHAVAAGERDAGRVRQILLETLESEPRVQVVYAEVADAETLDPLELLDDPARAVALLAAKVGPARLIDNAPLRD